MSRNPSSRLRVAGAGMATATVLGAGALLGAAVPPANPLATTPPPAAAANTPATSPGVARLDELNEAFATVAARVKPSVVYITATRTAARVAQGEGGRGQVTPQLPALPPEFERFFRDFGGSEGLPRTGPQLPRSAPRGGTGAGSGFVVSRDGYILTNAHVVDGADKVTVRLLDRREFTARVVGTDPSTDVAVLKIDATGLTPAPLGDSDAARVGEWVLAVGNPLGERLTFTVTSGIISAKGRALDLPNSSARSIQDFIQTDAAINPGNSGGPLVNVRGEVIGINTAIASPTGSYAGYGFAVPIGLARQVMDQLVKSGRVERAALGIAVRDASAEDAAYVGLPAPRGVLVQDLEPSSPARRGGLQPGDVIVAVDGTPVDYVSQLQERVAFRKPGEVVALEVARKGGARATVRVTLQAVADGAPAAARADAADEPEGADKAPVRGLGIRVAPLDEAAAQQLALPAEARGGVLVAGVDEGSPAAGRLAAGTGGPDVITAVEGAAVRTPDELRAALGRVRPGEVVTLRVYNAQAKTWRVERVRVAG
jgi:serine protease Do